MKIAIFHNYMDNIGGAEIVTLVLARAFDAKIYTTNISPEKIKSAGFEDVLPRIISIGKVPTRAPFKQQFSFWKFRHLNLSGQYDFFIISGDWAMSGAVNNKPNLWYVHSPINEIWAFKDYVASTLSFWKKPIFRLWAFMNRRLSVKYSEHVKVWVCNSKNTLARIKKYYKKDATVVYPPIDIDKFYCGEPKGYWLSVNRAVAHKRIEMQIEAFKKMPDKKLIIVASYEKGAEQFEDYVKYLFSIKPDNVEIRHWVSDKELIDLYAHCIGFITTALDEDFGMTVVEAMASGKPVVAPNAGGYRESVVSGQTGFLIDDVSSEKVVEKVKEINQILIQNGKSYFKINCLKHVIEFDESVFINHIKSLLIKNF